MNTNKLFSVLCLAALSISFASPLATAKSTDMLDMADQLDKLDQQDFQSFLDKANDCTRARNFSCSEEQLRNAAKLVNGSGDKLALNTSTQKLQAEKQKVEDEVRAKAEQERLAEEERRAQALRAQQAQASSGPGALQTLFALGAGAYVGTMTKGLTAAQQTNMMESTVKSVMNNDPSQLQNTSNQILAQRQQQINAQASANPTQRQPQASDLIADLSKNRVDPNAANAARAQQPGIYSQAQTNNTRQPQANPAGAIGRSGSGGNNSLSLASASQGVAGQGVSMNGGNGGNPTGAGRTAGAGATYVATAGNQAGGNNTARGGSNVSAANAYGGTNTQGNIATSANGGSASSSQLGGNGGAAGTQSTAKAGGYFWCKDSEWVSRLGPTEAEARAKAEKAAHEMINGMSTPERRGFTVSSVVCKIAYEVFGTMDCIATVQFEKRKFTSDLQVSPCNSGNEVGQGMSK